MAGEGSGGTSNKVSGGTFNGPVVQARDLVQPTFVTSQAPAAPVALDQLPPLASGFTGREAELAQVAGLLDPAGDAGAVVVSAVAGLAGVGKTALAVQAAHAARSSGWFPGGVLFIDLHGYDEVPVQPGQALDALLRALGIAGEHIPEETEARAALYRSALAQIKDSVLIVADNASTEAQVRLLVPGSGPHRVVITSRHTLAGLGARLLDVTVLDQAVAEALLDKVVREARPGDDRISGDQAAAGRLAGVCGGLPLALQLTAALLVADPVLTAAELAGRMADEVRRLEALRYDDGTGVSVPSVAATFELSYRQLDEDAALLFRLIPTDPGPDVSTWGAAELAGWSVDRARAVIGRLVRAHLVELAGRPGRWRMHDLLRLFARQLPEASPGERDQAVGRVLTWYLKHADAADQHLRALAGLPVPTEFTGRNDALAWLDDNRPNLVAAVTLAAGTGRTQEAMVLPLYLSEYLEWRWLLDDWLAVLAVSRGSGRRLNDKGGEAAALANLGRALQGVRRFEEAISACQDAAAICRETGDQRGEALALANLGLALQGVRRFEEAISACQDAAAICRETGDRHREGATLIGLGAALQEVRRFEEAISACRDAAAICRETGDRHREGMALNNLGAAQLGVRRFEEAISACQDAAAICRETGDRHGEALALANLGLALQGVGRFEEAISACQDAAAICRETGDRHSEGLALANLGLGLRAVERFEEAISACQDAAVIYREAGDRHREGAALIGLGLALQGVERFEEAISACRDAAVIFREAGDRHREGAALIGLGAAQLEVERFEEAISACRDAAVIFREAGDRHREGAALAILGTALRKVKQFEEAIDCCQQDIAICKETGDLYGESGTLDNLAGIYREMGQSSRAATYWRAAAAAMRIVGDHEEAARLEQLAANARTRRRWWRASRSAAI
jgi:tetratricopeptide (TPR) repeat protein